MKKTTRGDIVLHLRGKQPNAAFVGYSVAEGDGFETRARPPSAGQWDFAEAFYRVQLKNFVNFSDAIPLSAVFAERQRELLDYFDANRASVMPKKIFYVRQGGRLQCLNGAYFSELDDDLFQALFDASPLLRESDSPNVPVSVRTSVQLSEIFIRNGQQQFALRIKALYGNRCCFPGCNVSDKRFLVASHIARWSDNESLRGDLGNGLCLCLMHDRAFEVGMFTLDRQGQIFAPKIIDDSDTFCGIAAHKGEKITMAAVPPNLSALAEHWQRTDLWPE